MDLGMYCLSMNCSTPEAIIIICTFSLVTGSMNHFTTAQIVYSTTSAGYTMMRLTVSGYRSYT